jgi:serine/threonine protein kinase
VLRGAGYKASPFRSSCLDDRGTWRELLGRDVKPEDILLQDDHVFVADFGIGKAISAMSDEAMTQTA